MIITRLHYKVTWGRKRTTHFWKVVSKLSRSFIWLLVDFVFSLLVEVILILLASSVYYICTLISIDIIIFIHIVHGALVDLSCKILARQYILAIYLLCRCIYIYFVCECVWEREEVEKMMQECVQNQTYLPIEIFKYAIKLN